MDCRRVETGSRKFNYDLVNKKEKATVRREDMKISDEVDILDRLPISTSCTSSSENSNIPGNLLFPDTAHVPSSKTNPTQRQGGQGWLKDSLLTLARGWFRNKGVTYS